jgi:hypothetical protein
VESVLGGREELQQAPRWTSHRSTKDVAEFIWGRLITAGAYAFNFAHCVSYGMLGAWAMWIKRKHPEVFYASALAHLPPGKKIPNQHESLMRDAMSKGIKLLPPLREQVVLTCWDGTEVITVRFNRWRYPKWKKAIWGTKLEHDLILVTGVKPGWRAAREIYANKMWVIDPDDN